MPRAALGVQGRKGLAGAESGAYAVESGGTHDQHERVATLHPLSWRVGQA